MHFNGPPPKCRLTPRWVAEVVDGHNKASGLDLL